jgi:hypothetical protein
VLASSDPQTIMAGFDNLEDAVINSIKEADAGLMHDRFGI